MQVLIAVAAAGTVAGAAWRLGALRGSGALAATPVGAVVLGFAGLGPALVLVLFFASSSALSALPRAAERARRGARQVMANGSAAAAAAVLFGSWRYAGLAFLGAIAAATADTWATEIGVRLGRRPRSILSLRPLPGGSSGAVSVPGTAAAALGGLAVAAAGLGLMRAAGSAVLAVTLAGLIGSTLDSVLGAGVQARYRCAACGATPEVARHDGCPRRATRIAGLPGLDNDAVNWVATLSGAATAVLLEHLLSAW